MMQETFAIERRVEFRDTDAAGIMHFSAFFTFMEEAEHALLRNLGLSVAPTVSGQAAHHPVELLGYGWPRVAASCQYHLPLKFEEVFQVRVSVRKLGTKSVTYAFEFLRGDQITAQGELTAVCCQRTEVGGIQGVPIPQRIKESLLPFLMPAE